MHDLFAFELLVRALERIFIDVGGLFALVFGGILLARNSLERAKFSLEIQPALANPQAITDYRIKLNTDLSVSVALAVIGALLLGISLYRSATFNMKEFIQEQSQLTPPAILQAPPASTSSPGTPTKSEAAHIPAQTPTPPAFSTVRSSEGGGTYASDEPVAWLRELGGFIVETPKASDQSAMTKKYAEEFFLKFLIQVEADNNVALSVAAADHRNEPSAAAALKFQKAMIDYFQVLNNGSIGDPKERNRHATGEIANLKSARDELLRAAKAKGIRVP